MIVLNRESLSETLDRVDQAFFDGPVMTEMQREKAAMWIAARQGKPGSYAGMFAPTPKDRIGSVRVFTGETVKSNAAVRHILGEEACRVLILLNVAVPAVKAALNLATLGMLQRLGQDEPQGEVHGMYCCGMCSVSYWRHVAAGGLDRNEQRLTAGVKQLKSCRTGDAHWRRFPFYYTLLALAEMDIRPAAEEMRYAAPALDRYLKRPQVEGEYSRRRRLLCERVLARC